MIVGTTSRNYQPAAMEANHPHLTTRKSFYVEISRARDRAELVTDDQAALKEQLESVTGERIAALEAVEPERAKGRARDWTRAGAPGERATGPRRKSGASRRSRQWSPPARRRGSIAVSGSDVSAPAAAGPER